MSKIQEFKSAARNFTNRLLDNPDAAGALIFVGAFTAGAIAGVAGFAAGYKLSTLLGSPADAKELITIAAGAVPGGTVVMATGAAIHDAFCRRDEKQRKAWAIENTGPQ